MVPVIVRLVFKFLRSLVQLLECPLIYCYYSFPGVHDCRVRRQIYSGTGNIELINKKNIVTMKINMNSVLKIANVYAQVVAQILF